MNLTMSRRSTPATRRPWRALLATVAATAIGGVGAVVVAGAGPAQAATIDTNANYVLINRHSGKALDIAGTSTDDGAMVQQWTRNDGAWQQFRFVSSGSGYYRLRAQHSGKVVDLWEWNVADGAEYRQWPDLNGTNQQFQVLDSDSGYVRLINRHSGKALEVWEWSTADGARISQYTDHNGANQQWQLVKLGGSTNPPPPPQSGLVGWATQNGGTTGGGSAGSTTVTSASALSSAISGSTARVVRVSGTITCSGMLSVGSNKTILGNSGATISGCGLNISGQRNVIIRNLNFRNWDDDAINVQESTTNVWIDHNSFTNGYDGAVDIKRESDFITVSWNRIYGHDKSMLLGHSDSHTADRGRLRVTYHHNWFDGSGTRHPRVRFGNPVHVYNNYYYNNEYGVASTMGAGVLVEGNYFENVDEPTLVGYASSDDGAIVQRNNHFVGSGTPESGGGSVAGIPYSYQLDSASSVKSIVTNGAGAGRITV